jgi:hypothetical protein
MPTRHSKVFLSHTCRYCFVGPSRNPPFNNRAGQLGQPFADIKINSTSTAYAHTVFVATLVGACDAEKKAHRADAKAGKAEEKFYPGRLKIEELYKTCVEDAGEDAVKDEQESLE